MDKKISLVRFIFLIICLLVVTLAVKYSTKDPLKSKGSVIVNGKETEADVFHYDNGDVSFSIDVSEYVQFD